MDGADFLIFVGKRIKSIRNDKKLTQSELAELCNFEKATMSRIESGRTNMRMLTLIKISTALEVRITDIINGIHEH
jgi:transcriptional regulator with XRE-family HTH domain